MPSTRTAFSVHTKEQSSVCVLDVRGELEIATVDALQPALETALSSGAPVVIDLSAVTFLDSQGLYALLVFRERLREAGRPLAIACWPGGAVALAFRVSGTDQLFVLAPTRHEAIAAVTDPPPVAPASLAIDGLRWWADRVLAPTARVTFRALRSLLR